MRIRAAASLGLAAALLSPAAFGQATPLVGCTGCWTQAPTLLAPPPRVGAAMAYDPAHHVTVLFGGFGAQSTLGDTWLWDGLIWHAVQPSISPPARGAAAFAWDGQDLL